MHFPFSKFFRRSVSRRRQTGSLGRGSFQAGIAQLSSERLEDRTLLSGNVSASLSGGKLTVVGDNADNDVTAEVTPMGDLVIAGQNGTTINGVAQWSIPATAVSHVAINMQGGDDSLAVDGGNPALASLSGLAWIQLGDGHDQLSLENLNFGGGLVVYGSGGDDAISIDNSHLRSGLVAGGTGADKIAISESAVDGLMRVWGQEGDDSIAISESKFDYKLRIDGGSEDDEILVSKIAVTEKSLGIWGASGNDEIQVEGSNIRHYLFAKGGSGDDQITISETKMGWHLWLDGDAGNDTLIANKVDVGTTAIILGYKGDDFIEFSESTADRATIRGYSGMDDIRVDTVNIDKSLRIYSGKDDDLVGVVDSHIGRKLYWDGSYGNDGFCMCGSTVGGLTKLVGGVGDDLISLSGNEFGYKTYVYGSYGNDTFVLAENDDVGNVFHRGLYVWMGKGNDSALVTGTHTFETKLNVYGSSGYDQIGIEDGQNFARRPRLYSVDIVDPGAVQPRVDDMLEYLENAFPNFRTSCFVKNPGVVIGDNPQVVLIIDVSGSTSSAFQGTPVGDVNGDGSADTILDAELAAIIAFHEEFVMAGLGMDSTVSVIVFATSAATIDLDPITPGVQTAVSPGLDLNMNGIFDFEEAVSGITSGFMGVGGSTNFESALVEATNLFPTIATPEGDPNVVFLSDGGNNTGGPFDDDVAALMGLGANLLAFGVGQGASLPDLQIINPNAMIFDSTDDFVQTFLDLI
ncbi:MAG: VWA domain-containing protein [Planctomycetaceae bacterium]|nr:VWA domain-containing protein [Planctomycetaceae bacterium]